MRASLISLSILAISVFILVSKLLTGACDLVAPDPESDTCCLDIQLFKSAHHRRFKRRMILSGIFGPEQTARFCDGWGAGEQRATHG